MTTKKGLLPDRYKQLDFFVCNILDASPKDDIGSMEHPVFSLSKKPDTRIRRYEHNGSVVEVVPNVYGLATIFDKDILIYCISQLTEALNRGREISKTVQVTAYDLLVATNRHTGGRNYKLLEQAFKRLSGTKIYTNIKTGGTRVKEGFGIIDKYRIIEKSPTNERMVSVEVTLSDWLFNAVCSKEVLSISNDYFRLGKALERRIYEIVRKHCGKQPSWKIGIKTLHKKSGSSGSVKLFKQKLKAIAETDHLPDYAILLDAENNTVTFMNRDQRIHIRRTIKASLAS
jgi:plasmid replication initiation protein